MVIEAPQALDELIPATPKVRRFARALLARFRQAFPGIEYELAWYSDSVNAQAYIRHNRKRVRVYGGLARHRLISRAGMAYAIAHETGHHLGGEPFDRTYSWLSSEIRADEWAFHEGLTKVFGPRQGAVVAVEGLAELIAVSPPNDTSRSHREQLLKEHAGVYSLRRSRAMAAVASMAPIFGARGDHHGDAV